MDEYVAILLQNGANRLLDAQKLDFSRREPVTKKQIYSNNGFDNRELTKGKQAH